MRPGHEVSFSTASIRARREMMVKIRSLLEEDVTLFWPALAVSAEDIVTVRELIDLRSLRLNGETGRITIPPVCYAPDCTAACKPGELHCGAHTGDGEE